MGDVGASLQSSAFSFKLSAFSLQPSRVQPLEFGVTPSEFGVQPSGCRSESARAGVQSSTFGVQSSAFRLPSEHTPKPGACTILTFGPNRNCAIVNLLDLRLPIYLRAQKPLMIAAWLIAAILLLRFAVDFAVAGPILAVPFWGLVALSLLVMGLNAFSSRPARERVKD